MKIRVLTTCALACLAALRRIGPKRVAFGHLWELGHAVGKGRAHKMHIDRALPMAKSQCNDVSVAFWGDRII